MSEHNDYYSILGHVKHHDVRKWLLDGARREGARTIHSLVEELSEDTLNRRFARMLAKS